MSLGLSIVKSLVEIMGGKIEVKSKVNSGTEFIVYLDFLRISNEEANEFIEKKENGQTDAKAKLSGRKILVVEDHPLNAQIAKRLLVSEGCEVLWANDGKKGFEIFDNSELNEIDAVLMDIRMPIMNGIEAEEAIRGLNREDAKVVPIIAMTANAYEEDINKSFEAGMNAHLAKPINPTKLYETIIKFLR